jgi:hypothetical protein
VIDSVVWSDSCLSIAGAGCGLIGVGVGEEQVRKVVAGIDGQMGQARWAARARPEKARP